MPKYVHIRISSFHPYNPISSSSWSRLTSPIPLPLCEQHRELHSNNGPWSSQHLEKPTLSLPLPYSWFGFSVAKFEQHHPVYRIRRRVRIVFRGRLCPFALAGRWDYTSIGYPSASSISSFSLAIMEKWLLVNMRFPMPNWMHAYAMFIY